MTGQTVSNYKHKRKQKQTSYKSNRPVMITSGASPYFLVHINAASSIARFTISYGLVLLQMMPT